MTPAWAVVAAASLAAATGPWLRSRIFAHTVAHGQPLRTNCPHCATTVLPPGWRGVLTPLSALGRCPHCRRSIGPPPGVLEVVAGTVLAILAWHAPSGWILAAWSWLGLLGVTLAVIDVRVHRLPDPLTATAASGALATLAAAALATGDPAPLTRSVLAALGLAALYLIPVLVRAGGMGPGDCKLALAIGMCLGAVSATAVLTATVLAVLLAGGYVTVMLLANRIGRRDTIAFGPFMLLGALLALALPTAG